VVAASGSRTAGGIVLAAGGLWCVGAWRRRHGTRIAAALGGAGLVGFVLSHLLGLVIGAWPAVIVVAAVAGALAWVYADAKDGRRPPAKARPQAEASG
jgi:CHASE2 domain-containing sensor protein